MQLIFYPYITVDGVEKDTILATFHNLEKVVSSAEFKAFLQARGVDIESAGLTGDYEIEDDEI